jgi:hypothetical protein
MAHLIHNGVDESANAGRCTEQRIAVRVFERGDRPAVLRFCQLRAVVVYRDGHRQRMICAAGRMMTVHRGFSFLPTLAPRAEARAAVRDECGRSALATPDTLAVVAEPTLGDGLAAFGADGITRRQMGAHHALA